ncbi:NAD(P)-binding protein [Mesorhizobium sp. INR15]|uniref:NAD(P)-binding protein n=1 Tax=Mesorhizobium sp. INR15 TaxID=2654248 RepID=UPI0027E48EB9|nr:NAD(P)-binding protein [Mesorhizobium sp. INR15]
MGSLTVSTSRPLRACGNMVACGSLNCSAKDLDDDCIERSYDVIIIGSGPGGGTMAWRLAQTGKRILLIERGGYLKA